MAYSSWREWNDAYTKALQKRNAAERTWEKSNRYGQGDPKLKAKYETAKANALAIQNDPDRPSSQVMVNTSHRFI